MSRSNGLRRGLRRFEVSRYFSSVTLGVSFIVAVSFLLKPESFPTHVLQKDFGLLNQFFHGSSTTWYGYVFPGGFEVELPQLHYPE